MAWQIVHNAKKLIMLVIYFNGLLPLLIMKRHGGSVATRINLSNLHIPIHTQMTSRNARAQEDTDFRVMHLLQDNPDITQRELAERLGVSVGRLNYCLKALMTRGWVKMQNFTNSKNKFGYMYLLTPDGVAQKAALTSKFLRRKLIEYDALKDEIESLGGHVLSRRQDE